MQSDCESIKKTYLEAVSNFQRRLELLELRISDRLNELKDTKCLLDQLIHIDDSVKTLTRGRDKYLNVLSKMIEIEKLISYPDFSTNDDISSKKALLLLNENRIRQEHQLLNQLSQYKGTLESFTSHDFTKLLPQLEIIRQTALKQAEDVKEIQNEVRKLVLVYAQTVQTTRSLLENLSSRCKLDD